MDFEDQVWMTLRSEAHDNIELIEEQHGLDVANVNNI